MNNFFNKLKRDYYEALKCNKLFLVFLLSFFVLGIIIAIICFIRFNSYLTIGNLTDKLMLDYLKRSCGVFRFFILRFLFYLLLVAIIVLLCCNKYSCFVVCFLMLYLGYNIIFNLCLITLCFGFFGFLYGLIVVFVLGLIFAFVLFSISILCCNCLKSCYGYFKEIGNIYTLLLLAIGIIFVLLILQIILMSLLSSTFIIVL